MASSHPRHTAGPGHAQHVDQGAWKSQIGIRLLTGEKIASEWFNNRRVVSEDDATAYAAGILRHNA